jgi:hypothetical protein
MPVLEKRSGYIITTTRGLRKDVFVNSRIIDSSNVESIAWPVDGEPLMIVKYKNSERLYGYIGVSRQRAVAAAYYRSTGEYINRRIKGHFQAVTIKA